MGIHSQMPALLKCPVYAESPDSLLGPVPGDSVNDAVRTVIEPCTIRDDPVDRLDIFSVNKEKSTDDLSFIIDADITVSAPDVTMDQFLRRPVGRPPLVGVPMLRHEPPRETVNLHHPVKILFR